MTNSDSSQITNPPPKSSYSLVHVEQPGQIITPVAFNGNNYDEWSRLFRPSLMAKGKLGYIDGTIIKPSATSDESKSWTEANALVTAWLLASIEPTLRKQISIRPEAKMVWNDIKNRFSQENEARLYQLEAELLACRQGPTKILMAYYGRMTVIWDAILDHDPLPYCSCNPCTCEWVNLMNARRDKKRVRDFLLGLDDRFTNIRSQIIGISPLPSLDLIYNRLLQDEGVRNLSSSKSDTTPDAMAFAARLHQGPRSSGGGRDSSDHRNNSAPSKYFCIACQKSGHSLKFCYQVTGKYPDSWNGPRNRIYLDPNATDLTNVVFVPDSRGNNASDRGKTPRSRAPAKANMASGSHGTSSQPPLTQFDKIDLNSLTPSELVELGSLWQAHKSDSTADRLNGNSSSFTWIIDTGASHHMSGCLSYFSNVKTIDPLSVGLPNGDLTIATKSGDIHLSPRLVLRNVLFAANLHCNLISVSSLLIDTTLTIQFSHNLCLIQDRTSKTVIGAG
ncbi:uncharacterized protein LOC141620265 [Silene latifolia]|uniref:uncharacterized protein LOC141620265 n=1 Tax=Silene latifolia TaxID=37657 RepID=UPI003D77FF9B